MFERWVGLLEREGTGWLQLADKLTLSTNSSATWWICKESTSDLQQSTPKVKWMCTSSSTFGGRVCCWIGATVMQEKETKDLLLLMLRIFPDPSGSWWSETYFLLLVCDNPACARGAGTRWSSRSVTTQAIPCFFDCKYGCSYNSHQRSQWCLHQIRGKGFPPSCTRRTF